VFIGYRIDESQTNVWLFSFMELLWPDAACFFIVKKIGSPPSRGRQSKGPVQQQQISDN
jgi:hypothetical protein